MWLEFGQCRMMKGITPRSRVIYESLSLAPSPSRFVSRCQLKIHPWYPHLHLQSPCHGSNTESPRFRNEMSPNSSSFVHSWPVQGDQRGIWNVNFMMGQPTRKRRASVKMKELAFVLDTVEIFVNWLVSYLMVNRKPKTWMRISLVTSHRLVYCKK